MKKKMRIRTTPSFKCRRLADYTRNALPEISEKSRQRMIAHWRAAGRDRMEKEIFNSCIVLKNLALVHRDMPMSADFILEQLMESSRALRSVYADILSAYRNGRGEDSFRILFERVPLKAAKNFALLLAKIERINPSELIVHMTAFEETFSSARMTKGMRRAERKSLITTMAAAAAIFAVLLNFTVVVVFMDTLSMLGQVF